MLLSMWEQQNCRVSYADELHYKCLVFCNYLTPGSVDLFNCNKLLSNEARYRLFLSRSRETFTWNNLKTLKLFKFGPSRSQRSSRCQSKYLPHVSIISTSRDTHPSIIHRVINAETLYFVTSLIPRSFERHRCTSGSLRFAAVVLSNYHSQTSVFRTASGSSSRELITVPCSSSIARSRGSWTLSGQPERSGVLTFTFCMQLLAAADSREPIAIVRSCSNPIVRAIGFNLNLITTPLCDPIQIVP